MTDQGTSVVSSITALREKLDALLDRLNRGLDGGYDAIRVSRDEFCDWTDALESVGEQLERAERREAALREEIAQLRAAMQVTSTSKALTSTDPEVVRAALASPAPPAPQEP